MMKNIGLVLEGGGMRGLYTAGVLDFFMEKELYFSYIIGVSAGACNALSYVSRQKGRSRKINIDYANDPRYINYMNLLKGNGIFDMNFVFDDIPNRLIPFDYDVFNNSTERLVIPATDCRTGRSVYFEKNRCKDIYSAVMASSSLPLLGKMVNLEGMLLLDGGIADPIPIKKAIQDGNPRNVIILTRDQHYIKEPMQGKLITKLFYSNYIKLNHALTNRHKVYNMTLEYIKKLEENGKAFVIRPNNPVQIKRLERNPDRLQELYMNGYNDAAYNFEKLYLWIMGCNEKEKHNTNEGRQGV